MRRWRSVPLAHDNRKGELDHQDNTARWLDRIDGVGSSALVQYDGAATMHRSDQAPRVGLMQRAIP